MKKVYSIFALVLSSFFLFSLKEVKASTYNYTIPESVITFTGTNISTMINTVQTFLENDNTYSDNYFIYYLPSNSLCYVYFTRYTNSSFYKIIYNSSGLRYNVKSQWVRYTFSSDFLSLTNFTSGDNVGNYVSGIYNANFILYSNYNISLGDSNIYNYTFLDKVYTNDVNVEDKFTTIYDIYEDYYGEPEPVDPTPELTSFYTTVVDKISYLCSYMATNTLFLAMFVIIIFIVIIELIFRRRL